MDTLINDLLTFSRLGRDAMLKKRVNLNELVNEVIRECSDETKNRDIQWSVSDLPEVFGDWPMLHVVFMNLLSNAVKFTKTRATAHIEIGMATRNKNETVIYIRDDGVGFDMKNAAKLFGVFQRLHKQEDFEGTGIGLANVRRIIERHGGRVWAESKVNKGATFYFSLPNETK